MLNMLLISSPDHCEATGSYLCRATSGPAELPEDQT